MARITNPRSMLWCGLIFCPAWYYPWRHHGSSRWQGRFFFSSRLATPANGSLWHAHTRNACHRPSFLCNLREPRAVEDLLVATEGNVSPYIPATDTFSGSSEILQFYRSYPYETCFQLGHHDIVLLDEVVLLWIPLRPMGCIRSPIPIRVGGRVKICIHTDRFLL